MLSSFAQSGLSGRGDLKRLFGRKTFAPDAAELPRADLCYDEALALFFCRRAVLPLAGTFFWPSADAAFRKIKVSLVPRVAAYVDRMLCRVYQTHIGGGRRAGH